MKSFFPQFPTEQSEGRAHRLIQSGAVLESIYGDAIKGEEMLNALENFLKKQDERGRYFTDALRKGAEEAKRKAEEAAEAEREAEKDDNLL